MSMRTRKQEMAEKAYSCVSGMKPGKTDEYLTIAKTFPALIHNSGLVQALAFARAKGGEKGAYNVYIKQLIDVMGENNLEAESRTADIVRYQYLSREAIEAATWLKRYAEALLEKENP